MIVPQAQARSSHLQGHTRRQCCGGVQEEELCPASSSLGSGQIFKDYAYSIDLSPPDIPEDLGNILKWNQFL